MLVPFQVRLRSNSNAASWLLRSCPPGHLLSLALARRRDAPAPLKISRGSCSQRAGPWPVPARRVCTSTATWRQRRPPAFPATSTCRASGAAAPPGGSHPAVAVLTWGALAGRRLCSSPSAQTVRRHSPPCCRQAMDVLKMTNRQAPVYCSKLPA